MSMARLYTTYLIHFFQSFSFRLPAKYNCWCFLVSLPQHFKSGICICQVQFYCSRYTNGVCGRNTPERLRARCGDHKQSTIFPDLSFTWRWRPPVVVEYLYFISVASNKYTHIYLLRYIVICLGALKMHSFCNEWFFPGLSWYWKMHFLLTWAKPLWIRFHICFIVFV
jgi:hypothetical protein